jgi:hypothetical protein
LPSKEEFAVVKSYLQKIASVNTFEEIYRQKTAFEDTYKLLATARTFRCSTALCESTFSVLTRIDRPQRLSMTHQRLANLIFLGFEKERTNNVDFQKVLRKFNERIFVCIFFLSIQIFNQIYAYTKELSI